MGGFGKVELLAPAGSYEGFVAALGAGADAVYLAGDRFGARAYAKNFTSEELLQAIKTAHTFGRRVYLTVNTLFKNKELEEQLLPYLAPLVEAGLDAVLVQDFGVLEVLHEAFPTLDLHASTQMAVMGPHGTAFLQDLGVTRVVPARELSLQELSRLRRDCPQMEVEVFIHGAMCYSYSGLCLFSSIAGGRSGNRGRCAQPCRLGYEVAGKGSCHPLSMKDMCVLPLLPSLYEAGVSSLKIEGRMKQPAYQAGVTRIYRKYMDLLEAEGPEGFRVKKEDMEELLGLYSRGGSCEGYYQKHNGKDMIFFQDGGKKGEGGENVLPSPTLSLCGRFSLSVGEVATLKVEGENRLTGASITVTGAPGQEAAKKPLCEEDIRSRLSKLGDTPFSWSTLDITLGENVFLPLGELNTLRRRAVEEIQKALGEKLCRQEVGPWNEVQARLLSSREEKEEKRLQEGKVVLTTSRTAEATPLPVYVSLLEGRALEAVLREPEVTGVYLPLSLLEEGLPRCQAAGKEAYLSLPQVVRQMPEDFGEKVEGYLSRGLSGFVCENLEAYAFLKERGLSKFCVLGSSLYTWNDQAVAFFRERGALRVSAPVELNEGELLHRDRWGLEMPVYGYLPLMVSAQCVRANTTGCDRSGGGARITDNDGRTFVSRCVCDPWGRGARKDCYNLLFNSLPLGLLPQWRQVLCLRPGSVSLSFTLESPQEVSRILHKYIDSFVHGREVADSQESTRGHFKRGVK